MTKIKNTKKGMAKKTLSISLVAAMLATSNVPVWATEFGDGSDTFVEFSAGAEEAAQAAAAEEAVADAPVVESEEAVPAAKPSFTDNNFKVASLNFSGSGTDLVLPTDAKNGSITWDKVSGTNTLTATVNVTKGDGAALDTDYTVEYAWFAGATSIEAAKTATLANNQFTASLTGIDPKYTGSNLKLFVGIKEKATDTEYKWKYYSNEIKINAAKLNERYTLTASTTTSYNGQEQKLPVTVTPKNTTTALTADQVKDLFNINYEGDATNVTTKGVTVKLTPKKEGYTGELKTSYMITPMTLNGNTETVAKHFKATLKSTATTYTYTGKDIKIKASDIELVDAASGADLSAYLDKDADGYIVCTNTTGSLKVGAALKPTFMLVQPEDGDNMNYRLSTNTTDNVATTVNSFKVEQLDLNDVIISIKPKKYDAGSTVSVVEADVTFTHKKTNESLDLWDDVSLTVPSDATAIGTYKVKVSPKGNTTTNGTFNVINSVETDLVVLNKDITGATFTNQGYATKAETFTGAQITKDPTKLGPVTLGNEKLYLNTDYKIEYGENIHAKKDRTDEGIIRIVGQGVYAGNSVTIRFDITPAKVSAATVSATKKVGLIDNAKASDYAEDMKLVVKAKNDNGNEFSLAANDYKVTYSFVNKNTNNDAKNEEGDAVKATIKILNPDFALETGFDGPESIIAKKFFKKENIHFMKNSYVYTGTAIVPEFRVVVDNKTVPSDQYSVTFSNNTKAGTATVEIVGTAAGSYNTEIKAKADFTITPANASDLTGKIKDQKFNGYQIIPIAEDFESLTLKGVNIDWNDFDLTYGENVNIGEGTVTLTPKKTNGNFTGTKTITFKIAADVLHGGDLEFFDKDGLMINTLAFNYDGTAKTAAKTVYTAPTGKKLVEGTDYEIKYVDNVHGKLDDKKTEATTDDEQKGIVLVVAKGTYGGDFDANGVVKGVYTDAEGNKIENVIYAEQFKINQESVAKSHISVSNGTYAAGLPVKPQVSVVVKGRKLVEGTDYTLNLSGNKDIVNATEKNSLKVKIEPKNGYMTAADLTFNWGIDKFNLANADVTIKDGKAVVKCGQLEVDASEYTTTANGDGTTTITAKATSKNYTGFKTVKSNGQLDEEKPAAPVLQEVKVVGNTATAILSGECDGADGYDYVISTDRDCIVNKDYDKVNKNIVKTETDFTYTQKGTYYAYCHAWKRVDGKKVFSDWSNAYRFTVTAVTPDQPAVSSVKVTGSTVTVTYTAAANADGYDVVLGTALKSVNGEMRPVEYGKLVKKNIKDGVVTATFKNVPKGTYYAGLHAFNRTSENGKKVFSPWSNTKKVTVK